MTSPPLQPDTIERLARAVYPSFAMVAGMQLDVFTPLQDGPLSVGQLAAALAVPPRKLRPLLYALVAAGLLTVQDERFANTPEAAHFLVRGQPAYRGATYEGLLLRWHATLHTAESMGGRTRRLYVVRYGRTPSCSPLQETKAAHDRLIPAQAVSDGGAPLNDK
jgi:methyltransferase family protein